MVVGLGTFSTHFAGYNEHYVLIGGTACSLVMVDRGLDFRATHDLDMVLCLEALSADFGKAFWGFIEAGGYENRQRSSGAEVFYRFMAPVQPDYPQMIELFSRVPDSLQLSGKTHLTPIPVGEEVASLSAILLDDHYYAFLKEGKTIINGVPVVDASHLIPLKSRAWIDLMARKAAGEPIDSRDIRKHKNDILRLYQLLSPASRIDLPSALRQDMILFLDRLEEGGVDLNSLGLKQLRLRDVLHHFRQIYQLDTSLAVRP
ncbi:MAG: hypothetical protein AB7F31_03905 [Parachlamydiales bacterium]